ncbi:LacI family DNA-binding transcriptional regulator [Microbacterium sp. X-17]|uniref:LacI family DNA-binding transcriptional regulator n=1 Tax=Microbacterium sp. X-17 TaxID=3144404 RepID=UPI0031F4D592
MPEETQRRVTAEDVAREAGVSRAAVSYALNGDPNGRLRAATRQRVLDAARRLEYHPTAAARHLSGAKSRSVLFLTPPEDGFEPLLTQYIVQLAHELGSLGLGLLWQMGVSGAPRPVGELSPALVLTSPTQEDSEFSSLALGFSVPVITAFPGRDEFIASAGRTQVEFLVSRGYQELVFIRSTGEHDARMNALREHAATQTAARSGVLISTVTWPDDPKLATRLVASLGARSGGGIGVCAYNDTIAVQVIAAAAAAGVSIPENLGVIGVDDTFAGQFLQPPLTSVSSDLSTFIPEFANYVAALVDGKKVEEAKIPVDRKVTVRNSTA